MGKQYRTARGKVVDLDELMLKNSQTIAVGNYKVNAQGDELGRDGQVIRTKNEVASEYYNQNPKAVQHKKPSTPQASIEEDIVYDVEEPVHIPAHTIPQIIPQIEQESVEIIPENKRKKTRSKKTELEDTDVL